MYPIITEERQLDDHKTLYSAFGAKLEPIGDLSTPLDSFSQLKDIVLKNILQQSDKDTIFFPYSRDKHTADISLWLESSPEYIAQKTGMFRYAAVAPIYCTNKIYSDVYDQMLEMFELYFSQDAVTQSKIYMFKKLSKYMKAFQSIGFRIVRSTEKKMIVDDSNIKAAWIGTNTALLKANTEALMLLLGRSTYVDDKVEKKFILDGKERKLIPHQETTPEWAANGQFYSTYGLN